METGPTDPLVGKKLADRYVVRRLIGTGAMGAVYEAEQVPIGRKVAVKVLLSGGEDDPAIVKRFFREAKAASLLTNPNTVVVHDFGRSADGILAIRNAKYPPSMMCAGSIFKNLLFHELPEAVQAQVDPKVICEGKVPSAWFLEQVGAKGIRNGGIQVADYHANLIYNTGTGTAQQVREIVGDLKARVEARFGFQVEEEVQYVGFGAACR